MDFSNQKCTALKKGQRFNPNTSAIATYPLTP